MSVVQIEANLLKLSPEERREFARWFYENENEFVDINDEADELSPEVKAELIRRRDEMDANPSMAVPITDEWFAQLRKKLADARPAQKSAC